MSHACTRRCSIERRTVLFGVGSPSYIADLWNPRGHVLYLARDPSSDKRCDTQEGADDLSEVLLVSHLVIQRLSCLIESKTVFGSRKTKQQLPAAGLEKLNALEWVGDELVNMFSNVFKAKQKSGMIFLDSYFGKQYVLGGHVRQTSVIENGGVRHKRLQVSFVCDRFSACTN